MEILPFGKDLSFPTLPFPPSYLPTKKTGPLLVVLPREVEKKRDQKFKLCWTTPLSHTHMVPPNLYRLKVDGKRRLGEETSQLLKDLTTFTLFSLESCVGFDEKQFSFSEWKIQYNDLHYRFVVV